MTKSINIATEKAAQMSREASAQQSQAHEAIKARAIINSEVSPSQIDWMQDLQNQVETFIINEENVAAQRADFAIQMLASLVNASRANGTLPNADMMAKEAIKYADALIAQLSTPKE